MPRRSIARTIHCAAEQTKFGTVSLASPPPCAAMSRIKRQLDESFERAAPPPPTMTAQQDTEHTKIEHETVRNTSQTIRALVSCAAARETEFNSARDCSALISKLCARRVCVAPEIDFNSSAELSGCRLAPAAARPAVVRRLPISPSDLLWEMPLITRDVTDACKLVDLLRWRRRHTFRCAQVAAEARCAPLDTLAIPICMRSALRSALAVDLASGGGPSHRLTQYKFHSANLI